MSDTLSRRANLTAEEKRALLARLLRKQARADCAAQGFVHHGFEEFAARSPDAIAVSFQGRDLPYGELNAHANRLAHHLRSLGVGRGSVVGLWVERSEQMIVGLLGILKSGGAYLPMDPSYPDARLRQILDDARVPVLVTQEGMRERLSWCSSRLVSLDGASTELAAEREDDPGVAVTASDLAYVIYTSGSTGRPKGVQIEHRALANFLESMRQQLGMATRDVLLAVTTLSFDIAALELFLPLTTGARLWLVSREVAADGARLLEQLDRSGATFLQATPATWRLLLEAGWSGSGGLTMLCGGEALPRELANRVRTRGACLWNMYGPTETTIWSAATPVEIEAGPVPIGRPISNTHIYVLDSRMRPVPVGVTGEIYIGGAGVARGYLNRPGLTAERFLPDFLGPRPMPGGRMYKTGDLGRWRADGAIEFHGRVDEQVKIRGFRVELGEVEAVLLQHPGVRAAIVVARQDGSGERQLVGYAVSREATAPSALELRGWLSEKLPEFMVPSAIVFLAALPLTPNGKIDRNSLMEIDITISEYTNGYAAPRGPIEEALVGIWSEVLGRRRIGVHDNFFDLGGHSLLAAQLLVRVRETLAVEFSLRDLFEAPTVAGVAGRVQVALRAGLVSQAPPMKPAGRDRPLPASFAQQRLWFLDQLEPGSPFYNIPVAVRLAGDLDLGALERALNEVVRRHEALRTTFAAVDGQPFQVIAPNVILTLPVIDLSSIPEPEREPESMRLLRAEAQRSFDLARGPLVRAGLLRFGQGEHVVFLTMHHINSDGWSIGIMVRELAALYDAFTEGRALVLPDLPVQYADYAVWQREWLQGEVMQVQLDYWKKQLAGVPALELRGDRPRPAVMSQRGGERSLVILKPLLAEARKLSRQEGATLFMTLLAAFQTLLHRYSGQDDFAVGAPIAGRTTSEIENLIGFFVNTLVLRVDLSGKPSFRALLRQVRQRALEAYTHGDVPFEQLVSVLQPKRDPSRTPLFQAMFSLQNAPLPALESPKLAFTPLAAGSGTAKFDLTLFAAETEHGLLTTLEYNADLFDPATIDRMLGHYQTLLESIVAHPDWPIGALPMLTEAQRRQLLQWNDAQADEGDGEGPDKAELDGFSDEELDSLLECSSEEEANHE